jgi:hypothetical protein
VRFATALALLLAIAIAGSSALDPQTWILMRAVGSLGPTGGWRCARTPTFRYDPSHEHADQALLADPPEQVVQARAPENEIDYVEVNLRQAEVTVWTHADTQQRYVYVLSPGHSQAITIDELSPTQGHELTICNAHLSDWKITAEHALG